jgi:hypothetical protein
MKSSLFWDIMPCSPLKVNRRFRGTGSNKASKKPTWKQVASRLTFNGLNCVISQKTDRLLQYMGNLVSHRASLVTRRIPAPLQGYKSQSPDPEMWFAEWAITEKPDSTRRLESCQDSLPFFQRTRMRRNLIKLRQHCLSAIQSKEWKSIWSLSVAELFLSFSHITIHCSSCAFRGSEGSYHSFSTTETNSKCTTYNPSLYTNAKHQYQTLTIATCTFIWYAPGFKIWPYSRIQGTGCHYTDTFMSASPYFNISEKGGDRTRGPCPCSVTDTATYAAR